MRSTTTAMVLPLSRDLGRQVGRVLDISVLEKTKGLLCFSPQLLEGFSPQLLEGFSPQDQDLLEIITPQGLFGFSPYGLFAFSSLALPGIFPQGQLCEKRFVVADTACLTGLMVKPVDNKVQLHQRGSFSSWKPSAPFYLPRRNFNTKPLADILNKSHSLADVKPVDNKVQLHQRGSFSSWKPSAPFCLLRRNFNTKPDSEDVISMDSFSGPGPGDSKLFLQNVEVEADKIKVKLNIDTLKAEFERDYRPLLASHCLMLPHKIDHVSNAFLDAQAHQFAKLNTLFLSSLDIMLRFKSLKEWQTKPLLDFIIKRRVFVADEWQVSYGNIELLEYDFEESNSAFVRAECDAAFTPSHLLRKAAGVTASGAIHQATGGTVSGAAVKTATTKLAHKATGGTVSGAAVKIGTAKLAIIIWRGRHLLWAEVFDGISCQNNNHAEILAALALLMKCEELKFDKVKLWTDSARTVGCINGSETIRMDDENRHTYFLLRSMHKKFSKLVAVRKSRELMFLADQLLKFQTLPLCNLEEAIKLQLPYLSGCPLFCITRNHITGRIINSFDERLKEMKKDGYIHQNGTTFYCKVAKECKFEEFQRIRSALRAIRVEVFMDGLKMNVQDATKVSGSMYSAEWSLSGTTVCYQDQISTESEQRTLAIVWDASVPPASYNHKDACTIIFAEDDEVQELLDAGIMEINPSTYFCFNRVVHQYKVYKDEVLEKN